MSKQTIDAKVAASAAWDTETQEVHGGQTWRLCDNFVEDFSVTTNAFGTPRDALKASTLALEHIHHYPAADCARAIESLSQFMQWPKSQLLIGNGASEFIDLCMRAAPQGSFKPGPYSAAYMEYNRAAIASGRQVIDAFDKTHDAAVTVIIHPNSPTGDFMSLDELECVVQETSGIVVVDESFMPFLGADWRRYSALELVEKYADQLIVLNSWTKLWSCPGLRLGSVACGEKWYKTFKKLQTPWSCNTLAQAFCESAAGDMEYMEKTWSVLPGWKKRQQDLLADLGWHVNVHSPLWVPWVFVDCGSAEVAEKATELAMKAGCPVRWCASFGTPQHLRLGVRAPQHQDILQHAWRAHFLNTPTQNGIHH